MVFLPTTAQAASFDCGKAATEIEKLICGDDELSKLDESLSKAYLQALERTDIKQKMIKSQRQWLKNERNVCQNAECPKKAYEIRIWELGLSSSYGTVFFRPPDRSTSSPKVLPEESKSQPTEPLGKAIQTEPGQAHESTLERPRKSDTDLSVNEQLLRAATSGSLEQVKTWLAKGADVNAKNQHSRTALSEAAEREDLEIVKFLVEKQADLNAKDVRGRTALMTAALKKNVDIVKFLVDKGADVNAKDNSGQTVLSLASAKNQPKMVRYLKAHGAKLSEVLTCSEPGDDDFPEQGVVTFLNDHTVYHFQDGETETADALEVWNKSPKEMCFFITTATNNYHTCSLGGKATAVRENESLLSGLL